MARKRRISAGKRSFAKHVMTIMSGRTIAFAINFLMTPLIARLFEPGDWGVAVLFLALSSTIGPLACLRYDKAIQVAPSDGEANQMAMLCIWLVLVAAGLAWVLVAFAEVTGLGPETLLQMGAWIWLLPVGIILEGKSTILEAWLARGKRFTSQATAEVLQSLCRTSTRLTTGAAAGSSTSWLIGSYLFAYVVKNGLLGWYSRHAPKLELRMDSAATYRRLAAHYGDFPKYNAPTAFLMSATRQLPIFILATFSGPEVVGFFGMADRVVRTPAHITANSVRTVFLQRIADIWNAGRSIRRPTLQTVAALAVLGSLPCAFLWVYGQEMITFLLGDRWEVAGYYCEIMAPYLFVQWLGPPLQGAAMVMKEQRLWFFLQFIASSSRLVVIPVAVWVSSAPEVILHTYIWSTIVSQLVVMTLVAMRLDANPPQVDARADTGA